MFNEALFPQDQEALNSFTQAVVTKLAQGGLVRIVTRNNRIIEVAAYHEATAHESAAFFSPGYEFGWYPNGRSFKNMNLDMIELL